MGDEPTGPLGGLGEISEGPFLETEAAVFSNEPGNTNTVIEAETDLFTPEPAREPSLIGPQEAEMAKAAIEVSATGADPAEALQAMIHPETPSANTIQNPGAIDVKPLAQDVIQETPKPATEISSTPINNLPPQTSEPISMVEAIAEKPDAQSALQTMARHEIAQEQMETADTQPVMASKPPEISDVATPQSQKKPVINQTPVIESVVTQAEQRSQGEDIQSIVEAPVLSERADLIATKGIEPSVVPEALDVGPIQIEPPQAAMEVTPETIKEPTQLAQGLDSDLRFQGIVEELKTKYLGSPEEIVLDERAQNLLFGAQDLRNGRTMTLIEMARREFAELYPEDAKYYDRYGIYQTPQADPLVNEADRWINKVANNRAIWGDRGTGDPEYKERLAHTSVIARIDYWNNFAYRYPEKAKAYAEMGHKDIAEAIPRAEQMRKEENRVYLDSLSRQNGTDLWDESSADLANRVNAGELNPKPHVLNSEIRLNEKNGGLV